MIYQAGRAEDEGPDDPKFATEAEALAYAQGEAVDNTVWAVWRWEDARPITIFLVWQGDVFRKEG